MYITQRHSVLYSICPLLISCLTSFTWYLVLIPGWMNFTRYNTLSSYHKRVVTASLTLIACSTLRFYPSNDCSWLTLRACLRYLIECYLSHTYVLGFILYICSFCWFKFQIWFHLIAWSADAFRIAHAIGWKQQGCKFYHIQ